MSRTFYGSVVAAAVFAILGCAVHHAVAADHCFYKGSMYSDGATACQAGSQYRCDDGDWKSIGVACSNDSPRVATSKPCDYGGVTYSTGSASCQSGTQFRCEDGRWATLGVSCPAADAPVRVVPSGKTCMFEGATVANGSTICRSGSTFLCNDGEWSNLGTLCR